MTTIRLIPCLDVDDGRVVKGVQFKALRDAGDPVERARFYHDEGADELVFLDVGASAKSRDTLLDVVEKVSREVFIPLTVGGGVRSAEDARAALEAGADKVSVCTAALKNPDLLREGADRFGAQCMVLSIDAKKEADGRYIAYTHGGRKSSGKEAVAWAQEAVELGAGEILLNAIDRDGMQGGYDLELTRRVAEAVTVPVIASGGAGQPSDLVDAVRDGKADAVLLASLLHDGLTTLPALKRELEQAQIPVRWS